MQSVSGERVQRFCRPVTHTHTHTLSVPYPSERSECSVQWYITLLTPWSRVLFEKLTVLQLVKKFPAFYGTRKFITTFTSARHMSLS
jgi:hypothetical protein